MSDRPDTFPQAEDRLFDRREIDGLQRTGAVRLDIVPMNLDNAAWSTNAIARNPAFQQTVVAALSFALMDDSEFLDQVTAAVGPDLRETLENALADAQPKDKKLPWYLHMAPPAGADAGLLRAEAWRDHASRVDGHSLRRGLTALLTPKDQAALLDVHLRDAQGELDAIKTAKLVAALADMVNTPQMAAARWDRRQQAGRRRAWADGGSRYPDPQVDWGYADAFSQDDVVAISGDVTNQFHAPLSDLAETTALGTGLSLLEGHGLRHAAADAPPAAPKPGKRPSPAAPQTP